jgi:hypothetical protein
MIDVLVEDFTALYHTACCSESPLAAAKDGEE